MQYNNSMQRTVLHAAAEAERVTVHGYKLLEALPEVLLSAT